MQSADRDRILAAGAGALRVAEAQLRAQLPSRDHDLAHLRAIREVMGLAARIEMVLSIEGNDDDRTQFRDMVLTSHVMPDDCDLIRVWEEVFKARDPAHAESLAALRGLLKRYDDGEFDPPADWSGGPDPYA